MHQALLFVIATLGYYLFGQFGLLLAIPPGFASAVWPAAGLSLFLYIKYRHWSTLLGIGLGSFLLNLGVASNNFSQLDINQLNLPLLISIGAMGQALFGQLLFRFLAAGTLNFDTSKTTIRFIALIAPISCIIGSSVGTYALLQLEFIQPNIALFTWLTWWIGDTIGITLFTPLLSILFQEKSFYRKLWVVIPTATIFITVLFFFFYSAENQKQSVTSKINESLQEFILKLESDFDLSKSILNSYASYYQASEFVSLDEFNLFSESILKQDTLLHAVSWTQIIPHKEREKLEQRYQQMGYPDWELTEINQQGERIRAKNRAEYFPVLYIYPLEINQKAFGLDLGFNKARLDALNKARISDKPVATAPITLAQENQQQKAFIVYFPVRKPVDSSNSGPHLKEDIFIGYVAGVYRIQAIIEQTLEEALQEGFSISVRDITDPENQTDLYIPTQSPHSLFEATQHIVEMGERKYELELYPNTDFKMSDKDWDSWIVLTMGVLLSSLLQALTLVLTGQTNQIKKEIDIKTEALQVAVKEAEQANQAKTNFLSNMSHEIRTPLNAIIGLIRMSLEQPLNKEANKWLHSAQTASNTLLALINHTLDYNKIEAGKVDFEYEAFDLGEILITLHAIFSLQAEEKGIHFRIELPDAIPSQVIGDPLRIDQVLLNLCGNAFKFTHQGEVVLRVNVARQYGGKVDLEFIVRDTGVGIPKELQKDLFEPFKQADSSTTRLYGGTGLGLSINKQLVDLMGGSIEFSSEESKGSQFKVSLTLSTPDDVTSISSESLKAQWDETPRTSERTEHSDNLSEMTPKSAQEGHEQAPQQSTTENDASLLHNKTILLVEDIAVNQLIAKHILNSLGATVNIAENGEQAVEIFQQNGEIDLILMDIQMPIMDGYEATRNIRSLENGAGIPIIAMTANAMASDIKTCLDTGMNAHIAKPIDPNDVRMKIVEQLNL